MTDTGTAPRSAPNRWLWAAGWLTVFASILLYAQALASAPMFRLGIAGQWTWLYDHSPYADRALLCAVVAALLGATCFVAIRFAGQLRGGRLALFLGSAVVFTFWLQATFPHLGRPGHAQAVYWMGTGKINPDFEEARQAAGIGDLLRAAQDPNRPFRIHVSTHPPGPVLFYYWQLKWWRWVPTGAALISSMVESALPYTTEARELLEERVWHSRMSASERATMYGSMLILWLAVAAGVVPLYWWAADVFGKPAAVGAVGSYALTPSLLLFNPMTDQLYVPLTLVLLAAWHFGWSRKNPALLVIAGVLTWCVLQFTLAFLVLIFVCAVQVALGMCDQRRWAVPWRLLGWMAAGFVVVLVVAWLAGYDSITVWRLCLANNAKFNISRTYWPWLAYNPLDFMLFLGLPTAMFAVKAVVGAVRRPAAGSAGQWLLALAITLAILHLSGTNRGEVARLWMFLMPLVGAGAAHALVNDRNDPARAVAVCGALLFVQAVAFKLSLDVMLPAVG